MNENSPALARIPVEPSAARRSGERRIAWTGHRPGLFADPSAARAATRAAARAAADEASGPTRLVVGGQRGVDIWAAEAACELGLPFDVVLPLEVPSFTRGWTGADRNALLCVLAQADSMEVVGGDPRHAYRRRNERLVEGADLLVAVWVGLEGGGTAETIHLARARGVPVRAILLPAAPGARGARGRGR